MPYSIYRNEAQLMPGNQTDQALVNKKDLSERDICTKFITPAIRDVKWSEMQFYEEFTLGKIHVRGKSVGRGKRKRADYVLFYQRNLPLAIIEAKDNNHDVGAGMQQAIEYADTLDIPFAYSSNGDGFIEHDRTKTEGPLERELGLHEFPTPTELWQRYKAWKDIQPDEEKIITQPYFLGGNLPRYYQQKAINRTIEAIVKGQNRILLVMATGTGKTHGGGPLGVTGVVIPVVMAAPATADKGSGARLRAGSARGMACRQSRSTV